VGAVWAVDIERFHSDLNHFNVGLNTKLLDFYRADFRISKKLKIFIIFKTMANYNYSSID